MAVFPRRVQFEGGELWTPDLQIGNNNGDEDGSDGCTDNSDGEGPPPLESVCSSDDEVRVACVKRSCATFTSIQDTYATGEETSQSEAVSSPGLLRLTYAGESYVTDKPATFEVWSFCINHCSC